MQLVDANKAIKMLELVETKSENQTKKVICKELISFLKSLPTIDAIPTEWLSKKRNETKEQGMPEMITKLLIAWRAERNKNG